MRAVKEFLKKTIEILTLGKYELKNKKYLESLKSSIASLELEKLKNQEQLKKLIDSVASFEKKEQSLISKERKLETILKCKEGEIDDLKKKINRLRLPAPSSRFVFSLP